MSIIIGITKNNIEKDREILRPFLEELANAGYVRRIILNDEDVTMQSFTEESNDILPAYVVDRLVKKIKNEKVV